MTSSHRDNKRPIAKDSAEVIAKNEKYTTLMIEKKLYLERHLLKLLVEDRDWTSTVDCSH